MARTNRERRLLRSQAHRDAAPAQVLFEPAGTPSKRFVHAYRGSVSVIPVPDDAQLASYTTAVAENNHLALGVRRIPLQFGL